MPDDDHGYDADVAVATISDIKELFLYRGAGHGNIGEFVAEHLNAMAALLKYRQVITSRLEEEDLFAEALLHMGLLLAPGSQRMRKAARAGLGKRGVKRFDDEAALVEIARRIVESGGQVSPKVAAAMTATQAIGGGTEQSRRDRLAKKFAMNRQYWLGRAANEILDEAFQRSGICRSDEPDTAWRKFSATMGPSAMVGIEHALELLRADDIYAAPTGSE